MGWPTMLVASMRAAMASGRVLVQVNEAGRFHTIGKIPDDLPDRWRVVARTVKPGPDEGWRRDGTFGLMDGEFR